MLLRDLAAGQRAAWSSSMVLLIAPVYNADGNERMALDNRPYQLGPVGGMGTRRNAQYRMDIMSSTPIVSAAACSTACASCAAAGPAANPDAKSATAINSPTRLAMATSRFPRLVFLGSKNHRNRC